MKDWLGILLTILILTAAGWVILTVGPHLLSALAYVVNGKPGTRRRAAKPTPDTPEPLVRSVET